MATILLSPGASKAATVDNCGTFLPSELCTDDIYSLLGTIANYMVGFFSLLFVLVIVIAGAQMASAGDSPDRLKAAKSRLMNAIVGLVLLLSFRAIIYVFGLTG